jgi:hypothetical protein
VREEHDELIGHIVDELKALPVVPADATARVLARVDAARRGEGPSATASDDDIIFFPSGTDEMAAQPTVRRHMPAAARSGRLGRRFMVSLPAAVGYALAATLAGFLIRGALPRNEPTVASVAPRGTDASQSAGVRVQPVRAAMSREAQEAPVAVQFVLDATRAKSVAVVGDFNAWDASATPLARDSASGVWSAVVGVPPGRHVYAFLVDGKTWTLDPRAPKTKDSDYGTEQSVMIVGLK